MIFVQLGTQIEMAIKVGYNYATMQCSREKNIIFYWFTIVETVSVVFNSQNLHLQYLVAAFCLFMRDFAISPSLNDVLFNNKIPGNEFNWAWNANAVK